MANKGYLEYLNKQSEKKFMKIMDLAFMLRETKDLTETLENNIRGLDEEIASIQKQLKTANKEEKQQLVTQMKDLGAQKNALKNEIAQLVGQSNRLRSDLSAMSDAKEFDIKAAKFVDYMCDIATQDPILRAKFQQKMITNFNMDYLSDYARQIARQIRLDETAGNIYENMSLLPSFHNRNSEAVQKALQISLVNDNIQSYLKRRAEGKKRKTRKGKGRKVKKTMRKRKYRK